jgi:hypothetical protein
MAWGRMANDGTRTSTHGWARQGSARLGVAGQGVAGQGVAWGRMANRLDLGTRRNRGEAWLGEAWHGKAGQGRAGHGAVWPITLERTAQWR